MGKRNGNLGTLAAPMVQAFTVKRRELGLSQSEAAVLGGKARQTIQDLEARRGSYPVATITRLVCSLLVYEASLEIATAPRSVSPLGNGRTEIDPIARPEIGV
jgi:DNA-binding XRE family transcriptional regulator